MIILGGTHKTIPGVTKAIILTDNKNYAEKLIHVLIQIILEIHSYIM